VALLRKLFRAKHIECRAMSGSVANGIALCALTKPGDTMMVVPRKHYGHYTWAEGGYPRHLGLRVEEIPFTQDGVKIDTDTFRERAGRLRPALIVLGSFIHLFPTPLGEIRQIADSVGAKVMYDGAHVIGLIAGQVFQDPLSEGAHILVGSTQKTLPGPIGGVLVCNDDEIADRVFSTTSALFSNYGNSRIAALAIVASEMLRFGKEYAAAIVGNARALAEALDAESLPVLGKAQGYTASHQVILDGSRWGGAKQVVDLLEKANIVSTRFALSSDYPHSLQNVSGVRFGTSTVTRLGMRDKEMQRIARSIGKVLHNAESADKIGRDLSELAKQFSKVHYSFDTLGPD
jgi:glycine hydroxymethyltransferase